jgi:ubiquinol-cytochrome c reductase cytochrome c1 subunit
MLRCFIFGLWFWFQPVVADIERGEYLVKHYCLGCHALVYGDIKTINHLDESDARRWFGVAPPDLSLIGLQHSRSWLVAYLQGFYPDENRPFGVNNHFSPNVLMPNVLESPLAKHNNNAKIDKDLLVHDIVDYLMFIATPEKEQRYFYGILVMGFCLIMLGFSYILKRHYRP